MLWPFYAQAGIAQSVCAQAIDRLVATTVASDVPAKRRRLSPLGERREISAGDTVLAGREFP